MAFGFSLAGGFGRVEEVFWFVLGFLVGFFWFCLFRFVFLFWFVFFNKDYMNSIMELSEISGEVFIWRGWSFTLAGDGKSQEKIHSTLLSGIRLPHYHWQYSISTTEI